MRQTSIDAYRQIRDGGLLSLMRWQVYEVLYEHGPLTAREVGSYMRGAMKLNAWKRLSELERQRVVIDVGLRECSVTGHVVTLWDVSGELPIPLTAPMRRADLIRQLAEALEAAADYCDGTNPVLFKTARWRNIEERVPALLLEARRHSRRRRDE